MIDSTSLWEPHSFGWTRCLQHGFNTKHVNDPFLCQWGVSIMLITEPLECSMASWIPRIGFESLRPHRPSWFFSTLTHTFPTSNKAYNPWVKATEFWTREAHPFPPGLSQLVFLHGILFILGLKKHVVWSSDEYNRSGIWLRRRHTLLPQMWYLLCEWYAPAKRESVSVAVMSNYRPHTLTAFTHVNCTQPDIPNKFSPSE